MVYYDCCWCGNCRTVSDRATQALWTVMMTDPLDRKSSSDAAAPVWKHLDVTSHH